MNALISWIIAAAVCGIAFLVLITVAIVKKRFTAFYASLALLLITVACCAMAAWTFAGRAYTRIQHAMEPRSGMEIYAALLGHPLPCVQVIASQDQLIPKIDTAIRLRARICPEELERILSEGGYSMERAPTVPSSERPTFSSALLGDTVLRFAKEIDPGRNWRTIDVRTDSTEAIIEDVLD